jgi:hypothetical protein
MKLPFLRSAVSMTPLMVRDVNDTEDRWWADPVPTRIRLGQKNIRIRKKILRIHNSAALYILALITGLF